MVGFFGLKIIILGAIPIVYWLLKRSCNAWSRKPVTDLTLLVASCLIVGLGVYVWKFVEAGHVLKVQDRIAIPRRNYVQKRVGTFNPEEEEALTQIVITGRADVGPPIYSNLAKAGFIERDMVGVWRVNKILQSQLEEWLKNRQS